MPLNCLPALPGVRRQPPDLRRLARIPVRRRPILRGWRWSLCGNRWSLCGSRSTFGNPRWTSYGCNSSATKRILPHDASTWQAMKSQSLRQNQKGA